MLKMNQVSKTFYIGTPNEHQALKNIDLTINTGDFVTVIGGNGAGKSTLLNLIAGVLLPDGGKIMLDDQDVTWMPEHTEFSRIRCVERQVIWVLMKTSRWLPAEARAEASAGAFPSLNVSNTGKFSASWI